MAEFRGTFRHGVIVLNGEHSAPRLREGERVEISRVPKDGNTKKRAAKPKRSKSSKQITEALGALFGSAKTRKDWRGKSTRRIASELRGKAQGWDRE